MRYVLKISQVKMKLICKFLCIYQEQHFVFWKQNNRPFKNAKFSGCENKSFTIFDTNILFMKWIDLLALRLLHLTSETSCKATELMNNGLTFHTTKGLSHTNHITNLAKWTNHKLSLHLLYMLYGFNTKQKVHSLCMMKYLRKTLTWSADDEITCQPFRFRFS